MAGDVMGCARGAVSKERIKEFFNHINSNHPVDWTRVYEDASYADGVNDVMKIFITWRDGPWIHHDEGSAKK